MTRWPLLLSPALLLGACSMAPRYVRPEAPVPAAWPKGPAYAAPTEAEPTPVTYAEIFRDARLQALIAQGLEANRDLREAAANLAAARAQVRVTRANQFPAVGVSGSASHQETGGGFGLNGEQYGLRAGISAFELDLFGRLASATEAQRNTALATEAAARTVRVSLVADLALAWATYGADRDLLDIARQTASNARRAVDLTRARLAGGIAPRTDLRQAEQVLETAQGDVALLQSQLAQDENAIRLLVGTDFDPALLPASVTDATRSFAALRAGTSSTVLLRRPDVLQAEYQLRAANADVGVARAELFPTISLTGLAGFASTALSSLFKAGSSSWSIGADASWSIFNAGGRRAAVRVSRAERDAALAGYERAIQTAFRDVADALADAGTLDERLRAAAANTAATADTARLTEASYRAGAASSLDNLDAQRSLYQTRRAEVSVQLAQAANRVTLYRVLGGDQTGLPPAPGASSISSSGSAPAPR